MKPDSRPADAPTARLDPIERAHLKDPADTSHRMFRYEPPAAFAGLMQRFWVPVWSVAPGREAPQRVLQYPVCLLVVTPDYARFYGASSGLSTTVLTGDGWAVGLMLAPAGGSLVARASAADFTDRFVDLVDLMGAAGGSLVDIVRAEMTPDPTSVTAHRAAMAAFADTLAGFLPIDGEGELVNHVVAFVESGPDVTRVEQVCVEFGMSERSMQRLIRRRIGLTPKWLIQRRRLQEAAERLRLHAATYADVAAELGYADQSHFIRDFSRVTAMTPGEFAALHRR